MNIQIERLKLTRLFLLENIKDLTAVELNKIPAGFNNNIIWNLGHMVAAQQGLAYVRAGLKPVLDEKLIAQFRTGTKPAQPLNENEIQEIKAQFISSLDLFLSDYEKNVFEGYVAWTTRYQVELKNIDDAIWFLAYHEGLHSGYITAMKKIVRQ